MSQAQSKNATAPATTLTAAVMRLDLTATAPEEPPLLFLDAPDDVLPLLPGVLDPVGSLSVVTAPPRTTARGSYVSNVRDSMSAHLRAGNLFVELSFVSK